VIQLVLEAEEPAPDKRLKSKVEGSSNPDRDKDRKIIHTP
tara:strand:- start:713 stop:832 length:120 start_codon:yes stop_codon:yes gene_type:complete